jgi:hypothetical protein
MLELAERPRLTRRRPVRIVVLVRSAKRKLAGPEQEYG